MPLLRFEVRNEYGLGQPELYKQADREDPKAVLDGVAVTGLVGILRQLGDLAEFASEVFHGLQEQVMTTASRSHKLAVRVEHIEASLPPLEKAVLAQTSHIHFAYTASTQWHPRIHNEQNHFIYNDLPRFIMDSYEECRHPPRLHALDKFDAGGPGSCLKRYSDPTFFKRVSGSYTEAISEKIQREKKPRRSKKKKSSRRNGELSRVASMPVHRGRMPSPVVHERTFSQTSSVVDMKYRSDLVSDSFDSRTGSGFIECDFNQSSSLQYGEQDSRHSSSRFMPHIDNREATFSDESTQLVDKRTLSAPSKEHIAPTSSCVSWDEKAEIVESMGQQSDRDDTPELVFSMNQQSDRDDAPELVLSMGQQSDRDDAPELVSADFDIDMQDKRAANFRNIDESPEVLSANVDQDTQDGRHANFRNIDEAQEALSANYDLDSQDSKAANFRNIDRMDIQLADEDTPKSVSNRNQLDENESETDYYMDALNTIESESENDLDCQTKREVEPDSSVVNNSKAEHEIDGSVTHSSDYCSPNIDSNSVTTGMSPPTVPDPVPSESITLEPIPQTFLKSCDSDHSLNADVCKSADIVDVPKVESAISHGLKVESVICDPSSSGSRVSELPDQSDNKNTSSVHESQDSHTENSCSQPVKLWTNGGLLGLEPSKPPVFTASNGTSRDQIDRSNGEMVGPHNLSDVQKVTPDILDYNAERSEKVSSCGIKKIPLLSFGLESKSENSAANTSDHNGQDGLNVSAGAASKTEFAPEVKATSAEARRENDGNSSLVFGLGHRLLVNGFHRKSLEHDERSEPVRHLYPDVSGQWSRQHHETQREISDNAFIEKLERGSPLGSPTSSPPLEHMKISFNPADGFEMSKLKLKFPDGSHYQESIRDAFPSFQLIPEPTSPLYNHDSDSDDDTFYRSSPYMSDDHPSHQSDSNSEEWESGGSPRGSTENELYDALSRMSSVGSVSSSLLVNRTRKDMFVDRGLQNIYNDNDAEPKLSVLDLPSFDTMNPVMLKETKAISDPTLKLGENKEDTPLPPPLPPVQWRVSKAQSDVAEDQQQDRSEAFKDALERKRANLRTINKDFLEAKQENKVERQKFNGQKETSKNANGVGMDEKEDFLHQIRTKSFSLRPTVQARPTFTPGPATNTKVTAILEKATAIRQAVGSDTGEDDDNWSDA